MKVVIIGGGPAGMLAAIGSAQNGNEVTILEKMDMLGKKLLITGKGRCNITSNLPIEDFIKNIPGNGMFMYSSFNNFDNNDIIKLLKEEGVETKVERGNRIFPVSDKSYDVQKALIKRLKKLNVNIILNAKAEEILVNNEKAYGVIAIVNGKPNKILADKVIIATGGKSYPGTGSTGDGYLLMQKLGHTITKIRPSLVPLTASKSKDLEFCKNMQGLSLKNVKIKLEDTQKNKIIYEDFGEMLFTHFGVSGPTILSSSAHLLRYKNVDELLRNGKIILSIDLKPALTEEKLDERILRDFNEEKNKAFKNSLDKLLPKKMIDTILELSKINPNKKVNEITKKERKDLIRVLKNLKIEINGFRPIDVGESGSIRLTGIPKLSATPLTFEIVS